MTDTATQQPVTPPAEPETPAVETPAVDPSATEPQEVPATEPDVSSVESEPTEPSEPLTRAEALKKMRDSLTRKTTPSQEAAEKPDAETQEGDETKQETQEEQPQGETEEPTPSGETQPQQTPEAEQQTPEPEPEPAEKPKYHVDIDPNHPVASTIKGPIVVGDETSAKAVKALLNGTYVRRNQVSEASRRADEAEEKYLELKTRIDAEKEWRTSDSYQQKVEKYNQLMTLEESGELNQGTAQEYWNAAQPEVDEKAKQAFDAERQKIQQERADRAAAEWTSDAWQRVQTTTPEALKTVPAFKQYFDEAVELFSMKVAKGAYPQLKPGDAEGLHREFRTFLNSQLVARPDIRAAYANMKKQEETKEQTAAEQRAAGERERARIEQEAIDRYKKQIAEERRETPPNPIANLGPASHDRASTPSSNGDENDAEMSPIGVRKQAAKKVREMARARRR